MFCGRVIVNQSKGSQLQGSKAAFELMWASFLKVNLLSQYLQNGNNEVRVKLLILNHNILKMERCRNFKFGENAFWLFSTFGQEWKTWLECPFNSKFWISNSLLTWVGILIRSAENWRHSLSAVYKKICTNTCLKSILLVYNVTITFFKQGFHTTF